MSLCIGLIYQARTLVSTRHLLTTVSDLWAVEMLSAASTVGRVLICEACVAVRFCQRKDGLSYLVIRQLWTKPWHRAVTLTGGGELQRAFPGRAATKGLCPADPLPFRLSPVRSCPRKYAKTVFTSAPWLCTGSGAQKLPVCVGVGWPGSR